MNDRLRVPLHYDFASTLCYVAKRCVERLEGEIERLGIELVWTPLDLASLAGWRRGVEVPEIRRQNAERVALEMGVTAHIPPTWLDSREPAAIAICLEGSPREATWRERVFSAIFEERRMLDGPGESLALARELTIEVPSAALESALDELHRRTEAAARAQVTGVPTFMLDTWPFGGIQEDRTMKSVLGRFAARARAHSDTKGAR